MGKRIKADNFEKQRKAFFVFLLLWNIICIDFIFVHAEITSVPVYVEVTKPEPTSTVFPTKKPQQNILKEEEPFWYFPIIFSVTAISGGVGLYWLFLLFLRKKRTFHGIFDETGIPGTRIKGMLEEEQRELWDVIGMIQKLNSGAITVEEYIEKVSTMTSYTIFPADTKMTVSIGERKYTGKATEKELFHILSEAHGELKMILTSKRTGMVLELDFVLS